MTEPKHAGSNPVWMSTTAEKDGDDYVIDGHKWFTTGFDGSSFVIIMAVTNPEAEKPHERASMLITPSDAPGLIHVRRIKIVGEEGEDHHSHSELRFENLRVPAENLLGEENAGFAIAQQRLGPGRIHHCMRWIGICERAFDLMCTRAAERELSPRQAFGGQAVRPELDRGVSSRHQRRAPLGFRRGRSASKEKAAARPGRKCPLSSFSSPTYS